MTDNIKELISERANEIRGFIQENDIENAKTYARDLHIKAENNDLFDL